MQQDSCQAAPKSIGAQAVEEEKELTAAQNENSEPDKKSEKPLTPAEEQYFASYKLLSSLDKHELKKLHHDSCNLKGAGAFSLILRSGLIILLFLPIFIIPFGFSLLEYIILQLILCSCILLLIFDIILFKKCRSTAAQTTFRIKAFLGIISAVTALFLCRNHENDYLFWLIIIYLIIPICLLRASWNQYLFGKNYPTDQQIAECRNASRQNKKYTIDQHPVAGKRLNWKLDKIIAGTVLILEILLFILILVLIVYNELAFHYAR